MGMNSIKTICILGFTGSIGTQTVTVAKKLGYKIVGCSFHSNVKLGQELITKNKIKFSYCSNDTVFGNCLSFDDLIKKCKPDLVVNAIVGFAGLQGTLAALHANKDLALANKESVVVAGWYIFAYAKKHNLKVIPIDSEHTNLYYQLLLADKKSVNQIYITGSGGKYLGNLPSNVSYEEATTHKNWLMGKKITIDSNTLINKCFEVIEAYWYFNTKRISVLWDKTSNIHSAILLNDGTFYHSFSKPTMIEPITMALTGFSQFKPDTKNRVLTNLLVKLNDLRPIKWAYQVMNDETNSLGIIINAANEVAHKLFKAKMIKFNQILDYIENSMKRIKPVKIKNIDQIYEFDQTCRLASIKYWK